MQKERRVMKKRGVLCKNRIEGISDGVYAIAMTLAVLSIDSEAVSPTHRSLLDAIPGMANELRHYLIAFLALATFWVAQHRMMDKLEKTDSSFNWLVMIHLLFISLIPVTTDLLGNYNSILAVHIFIVNVFLISISMSAEQYYLDRNTRLTRSREPLVSPYWKVVIVPLYSFLVFAAAWFFKEWATVLYLFVPIIGRYIYN
ncbi:MAG: DUF1211 domain-containing protein [Candidatus Aegiribacteria sp.]|nr:DUF1211 domain-containing protein [Candidatus Aegiribacteria sp.]MBD3294620.1 DUF1211 domain-containing protein [Candidatus Fermentibacteria bacterium]